VAKLIGVMVMLGDFYYCQKCGIKHNLNNSKYEIHPNQKQCLDSAMEWYPVLVEWENDSIEDEIKGLNVNHALERAKWNWPDAKEIFIRNEE
jgi:hypothetical protein